MKAGSRGRLLPFFYSLLFLLSLFTSMKATAYPHFVTYGYTSCSVCHYHPLGNGPLTDYGRALGATEFSGKPFWNLGASDEQIGASSGFWGGKVLHEQIRPSFDLRMLRIMEGLQGGDKNNRFIWMSADLNVVALSKNQKFYLSGSLGYIPPHATGKRLISREHYVAWRPTKEWGIYGGFMDTAFGTRIPDHTAFSRTATGLAQNDQTHGLMLNYLTSKSELYVHGFAGNLAVDSDIRQKGGSILYEFEPKPKWRLGGSVLHSQSPFRKRSMFSIHSRSGYEGGAGLITEVGIVRSAVIDNDPYLSVYTLIQAFTKAARGLHYLLTFEHLNSKDTGLRTNRFQAGPSIVYSPFQRMELRMDLQGYREFGAVENGTTPDSLRLLGQVHVYF